MKYDKTMRRGRSRCPNCNVFVAGRHEAKECIAILKDEVGRLRVEVSDARDQFQLERARKLLSSVGPLPSLRPTFANALIAAVRRRNPDLRLPVSLAVHLEGALGDLGF